MMCFLLCGFLARLWLGQVFIEPGPVLSCNWAGNCESDLETLVKNISRYLQADVCLAATVDVPMVYAGILFEDIFFRHHFTLTKAWLFSNLSLGSEIQEMNT